MMRAEVGEPPESTVDDVRETLLLAHLHLNLLLYIILLEYFVVTCNLPSNDLAIVMQPVLES